MDKCIEERASFPDKPFKPYAVKAWRALFSMAEQYGDVAVCNDDGNGVTLCLRDSSIYDGDYYALDMADVPFVHIDVDGVHERLFAIPEDAEFEIKLEALAAEVRAWMEKGIMEAFHTAAIQKAYQRYNPEGKRFSIVSDHYENGAFGPDLSLLWSHQKRSFTVAQIRTRQKAARKKYEAPDTPKMQVAIKAKPKPQKKRKKLLPKPFKASALRGWNDLFSAVVGFHSIIYFEIDAEGGTVTLITYPPSEAPECVSMMLPPSVDDLIESEDEREKATAEYVAWVKKGILDAFHSARIQKKYAQYNPDGKNCAIVISEKVECGPTEYELTKLDLSQLWTNNPKFTLSRIKAQDRARVKKRESAKEKRDAEKKKVRRSSVQAPDSARISKLVKEHFKKPFKPKALELWNDFFEETENFHNIAHWAIYVGIGSINLTAQHSSIDESKAERINNRHASFVHLFNWDRMLKKGVSEEDATAAYRAWVEKGIMDAFNSKRIQNKLKKYNSQNSRFAVVSTVGFMLPMVNDELTLLWSNNPSFTVAGIMSQQRKAVKKGSSV